MDIKSNIWKLYISRFFRGLIPAYAIEMLFFEQRGMTIQTLVYIEIIYAITVVLLEIPSGIISDRYGYKRMLVFSGILACLEFIILLHSHAFIHFAIVVIMAGIGKCACSGSENALLYESLRSIGKEQDFEGHVGRLNAMDFTAVVIAALAGGMLAGRYGFELNYVISAVSMFLSLLITIMMREPSNTGKFPDGRGMGTDGYFPFKKYAASSVRFFREEPGVSIVLLAGMITGATLNFLEEFWQIYFERLRIPVAWYGVFLSFFILLKLPGNILASVFRKRFGLRIILSGVAAVFAAGFIYMSLSQDSSSLAALAVVGLFSGITDPLIIGYLHHKICDNDMRATIESFQSLGLKGFTALTGIGFGYVSQRFDIFGGYGFAGIVCAAFLIYFIVASRKVTEREPKQDSQAGIKTGKTRTMQDSRAGTEIGLSDREPHAK